MGIFTFPAVLKRRASGILVPSGLIVPYNDTTAPDGWNLFTSADGKFIIGAGNTYAVAATGGNTSITTSDSDSQGAHTGYTAAVDLGNSGAARTGTSSGGAHTHTLTYTYEPPYYGLRLIKANAEIDQLPAKAVMLSGTTISGLTRFSSGDGKYFSARSSIGAGGSNTISGFTSSSDGAHAHGSLNSWSSGAFVDRVPAITPGAHTHPNTDFNITPGLYRALLSAWTDASNAFNLQVGMYAFYENTTPPDGWYLCNGSNGTLDLRDYFIQFTDETDDGTRAGDGTISVPDITLTSVSNSHSHRTTGDGLAFVPRYHDTYTNTHSHTISGTTPTFLPPYYALAIIQLAA